MIALRLDSIRSRTSPIPRCPMAKPTPISPLAPAAFPVCPAIPGVRIATAQAGIRYAGRTDVLLAVLDEGTTAAGVFTRSRCPSAPVDWCRGVLPAGGARALVVNSGNANAFTGARGRDAVRLTASLAAEAAACRPDEVYLASTGVIGEPLDATRFEGVLGEMARRAEPGRYEDAARAIMTTDTFPKGAAARADLGGVDVDIVGIAKGAGMIAPDMATLLSFVFTDAAIAPPVLQRLLSDGVVDSFNALTVDSDTSTSDTLLLFATGAATMAPILALEDPRVPAFAAALEAAPRRPRQAGGTRRGGRPQVRDGRGRTARRRRRPRAASRCRSPTRPWSRRPSPARTQIGAVSSWRSARPARRPTGTACRSGSGASASPSTVPGTLPTTRPRPRPICAATRSSIRVDLGLGRFQDRVFTCDLTKDYVAINGDYRS